MTQKGVCQLLIPYARKRTFLIQGKKSWLTEAGSHKEAGRKNVKQISLGMGKMVRVAICDDDRKGAEAVGRIVEKCCREKEILYGSRIFHDSRALLYDVQEGEYYDVILLDIEMPELDGIELAGRVRTYLPEIITIFVTSYEQYVYKSFKVQPYRFVPKKDVEEMLPEAVKDAVGLAHGREGKFFIAENQKGLEKIALKSIAYIWHREKYAYIERTDRGHTKVRKTLKEIYRDLPEGDFAWVDRGCIVNLAQIERITEKGVFLSDGTMLNTGRVRIADLKDRLRGYWTEKEGLQ